MFLWLPTPVSHRTFRHSFQTKLPSLTDLCQRERNLRCRQGTSHVTYDWQRMLDDGLVKNRAELARRVGVSRARITWALQHT
jgi:hypothetical protein